MSEREVFLQSALSTGCPVDQVRNLSRERQTRFIGARVDDNRRGRSVEVLANDAQRYGSPAHGPPQASRTTGADCFGLLIGPVYILWRSLRYSRYTPMQTDSIMHSLHSSGRHLRS